MWQSHQGHSCLCEPDLAVMHMWCGVALDCLQARMIFEPVLGMTPLVAVLKQQHKCVPLVKGARLAGWGGVGWGNDMLNTPSATLALSTVLLIFAQQLTFVPGCPDSHHVAGTRTLAGVRCTSHVLPLVTQQPFGC